MCVCIYIYIYIYREREREKNCSKSNLLSYIKCFAHMSSDMK